MAKTREKSKNKRDTLASRADRHDLYERSVQCAPDEVSFLREKFVALRGRQPRTLREDFCGTANAACEWVRSDKRHRAVGVDFDAEVLAWGRRNNLSRLTSGERRRIRLLQSDVRDVHIDPTDIVVAFNFSYWTFKTRDRLRRYFECARAGIGEKGLFFLDAYGGADAYTEMKETTKHDGFTYIWDQASFDPVTSDYLCHIHFRFPDGSKLKKAFSYEWRLWSLPEVHELLLEAGFGKVTIYWEQTGEDGHGNGHYEPVEHGEADPAWITYLAAEA